MKAMSGVAFPAVLPAGEHTPVLTELQPASQFEDDETIRLDSKEEDVQDSQDAQDVLDAQESQESQESQTTQGPPSSRWFTRKGSVGRLLQASMLSLASNLDTLYESSCEQQEEGESLPLTGLSIMRCSSSKTQAPPDRALPPPGNGFAGLADPSLQDLFTVTTVRVENVNMNLDTCLLDDSAISVVESTTEGPSGWG